MITPTRSSPAKPPVLGIVGWKSSGKTTLLTRLVTHYTASGLSVATIKRTHHAPTWEHDETDTARHRRAGAIRTILVCPTGCWIDETPFTAETHDLGSFTERLHDADLILVEGFKTAPMLKIETRRSAQQTRAPLSADMSDIIAIATDRTNLGLTPPEFARDAIAEIADFAKQRFQSRA
ncbi:MAG: molybdopterin-guanine dinucleotide biosynthesis protein B [Pseudomonadota bacterium]